MYRVLLGITLACGFAACSKKSDPSPNQPANPNSGPTPPKQTERDLSKVDFTLTMDDFMKEWHKDSEAATRKYRNKVIEISGRVDSCNISKTTRDVNVGPSQPPNKEPERERSFPVPLDKSEWDKEQGLRALSRGQSITLRGVGGDGNLTGTFDNMKIVKLGPSTAKPITLRAIAENLKDDTKKKEFDVVDVLARVKVVEPASSDAKHIYWVIVDAEGESPQFWLGGRLVGSDLATEELKALKPGDVVLILGQVEWATDKPSIQSARLLKEPPAGVKLPEHKK
jgi:hypothetical protein